MSQKRKRQRSWILQNRGKSYTDKGVKEVRRRVAGKDSLGSFGRCGWGWKRDRETHGETSKRCAKLYITTVKESEDLLNLMGKTEVTSSVT